MDGPLLQRALRSPELLGTVLILLAVYAIRLLLPFHSKKIDFPVLGKPGDVDYHAVLDEGYKKVELPIALTNHSPERLITAGNVVQGLDIHHSDSSSRDSRCAQ